METGRPPKYTPELLAHIIDNIAAGVPYRLAAKFAGIMESTLYDWLAKGNKYLEDKIDHPLASFSESIKEKENAKLLEFMSKIKGADKNWQASAWMLERRWWKDFSASAPLMEMNRQMEEFLESQRNGKAEEMDSEGDKSGT